MRAPKKQVGPYAGKLSAYGDPKLDQMVADASVPRARAVKEKIDLPQRCPGCGNVAMLHKGFVAILCDECHQDIEQRARKKPGMCYDAF